MRRHRPCLFLKGIVQCLQSSIHGEPSQCCTSMDAYNFESFGVVSISRMLCIQVFKFVMCIWLHLTLYGLYYLVLTGGQWNETRPDMRPPHLGGLFKSTGFLFVDESHMSKKEARRRRGRSKRVCLIRSKASTSLLKRRL